MIRHCAFFRFRSDVAEPEILTLLVEFETLVPQCPGFLTLEWGENISREGLDHGFRHGIVAEFSDMDALEAYLQHPAHVEIAEKLISKLKTSATQDIVVFDLNLN